MAAIQLAATGSADIFLTGSPQVTHFKATYKRHVSWASEAIENVFQGPANFGTRSTITLQKAGDLAGAVWLQIQLSDLRDSSAFVPQARQESSATIQRAYHDSAASANVAIAQPTLGTWTHATALVSNADAVRDTLAPAISSVGVVGAQGLQANIVATPPTSPPPSPLVHYEFIVKDGLGNQMLTQPTPNPWIVVGNMSLGNTFSVEVKAKYEDNSYSPSSQKVYWASQATSSASSLTNIVVSSLPRAAAWAATGTCTNADTGTVSGSGLAQEVQNVKWANNLGTALLNAVEFEIGGVRIERHTMPWYDIHQELTETQEKKAGIDAMLLNYGEEYDIWNFDKSSNRPELLFVPVRFVWNRMPSMALPLVALQFHSVLLNFEFAPYLACIKSARPLTVLTPEPSFASIQCFVDYYFLAQDERVRYASNPSEYLLQNIQFQGAQPILGKDSPSFTLNRKISLNFTQPTKELIFVYQSYDNYQQNPYTGNNWFDYNIKAAPQTEPFRSVQLFFNGHARFSPRPGAFFRQVVPYQCHTRVPSKRVYCWSAALNPEDAVMPSGSYNSSRLDSVQLSLELDPDIVTGRLLVFASTWNVLRVSNGMAGTVFSSG